MKKVIITLLLLMISLFADPIFLNGLKFDIEDDTDLIVRMVDENGNDPIVFKKYLGIPEAGAQQTIFANISNGRYRIETSCDRPRWEVDEVDEIRK